MPGTAPMVSLVHFDKARLALAEATRLDEVKLIRDQAEVLRQYIRQQKGTFEMQNQCAEIKLRAERRAGEMLAEQGRAQGQRDETFHDETFVIPKLSELGISNLQSHRWQLEATIPEEQFERFIAETKAKADELTSRATLSVAMKMKHEAKKQTTSDSSIPEGLFEVIVIDPPWPYGGTYDFYVHRVESPYYEKSIEDLMILDIPAAENCILWLWSTNAFLHEAYHIVEAWAFEPKSILTWFKQQTGVGHWLRGQTEHCILAVKGKPIITHVAQGTALIAKAREHSHKPEEFYQLVESLCPGRKLEMFARTERKGWSVHGDQL